MRRLIRTVIPGCEMFDFYAKILDAVEIFSAVLLDEFYIKMISYLYQIRREFVWNPNNGWLKKKN